MSEIREQPVYLQHEGVEQGAGHLHIAEYDKADRGKRAAVAWLICWGLSLASLPIIFAHWVLVPGFFLAGPFFAYRFYHIHSVPKKITGKCPQCKQDVMIPVESSDVLPLWTYCPSCNQSLHVVAAMARE